MPLTTQEIQLIITIFGVFFSVGGAYGIITTKNKYNDKKFENIDKELCKLSNKIDEHKREANIDDDKMRSDILTDFSDFKKSFGEFKERFFKISDSIIERIHTLELQTVKKSDCVRQIKDCHLDSQSRLGELKALINSINEDFKKTLNTRHDKHDDEIPRILDEIKRLNENLNKINN